MFSYFVRRLLLMIPTFLGCTIIVFLVLQITPGGPLDQIKLRFAAQQGGEGASGGGDINSGMNIPEEALNELKKYFDLDKPMHIRYLKWLGKTVQGDLGDSYVYAEPVVDVISSRFPISIYFGLISLILTYSICIPLGILKAIKNGSPFDVGSSIVVFIGYSIPGFALGILLLVFFARELAWFPQSGFRSDNWEYLSSWEKVMDQINHTILPVIAYMAGSFAVLTVLTKNSLLENLSQDYVRTAFAKGLTEKRVLVVHAFRNSLIPIVTGLSSIFGVFLAGSFLVERVFDIHGIGMLGYKSILARDYTVMMGLLVFQVSILLFGNLFRDFLYAVVDPRIRFS